MEVKAKLNEIQGILTSLDSELISDEDPLKINELTDFMNKNLYQYNPVAAEISNLMKMCLYTKIESMVERRQ